MLFSCNRKEKKEYVDRSKHPTIFFDINKSDTVLNTILDNITENSYVGIKKYKGKYYLYIPCEMMNYTQIDISKDTVKIMGGEGDVMRIDSIEQKKGVTKYQLKNEFTSVSLELKNIDSKREIYVGKFTWIFNDSSSYFLFVKGFEIEQYPVIVNACTLEKVHELDFDKEDLSNYFE